jgi:hypothetical protein
LEPSSSGIDVGLAGVGRIGPHGAVHNLRRFFHVYVQRCFQAVSLLADVPVAGVTNRSRLEFAIVVLLHDAAEGGGGVDLGVGRERL